MKGLLPWGNAEDGSEPSWLLTLADLLSLLLTFFVLLFSMNAVQYKDWESVVQTLSRELNPARPKIIVQELKEGEALGENKVIGGNLNFLSSLLRDRINEDDLLTNVKVTTLRDRVVISIPASLGYPYKSHGLGDEAQAHIGQLASLFSQISNKVMVAGHTNREKIPTGGAYTSNWELALTRAREVAGLITVAGYGRPIAVISFADTRFNELDENIPLNQRYDLAERVDIIILDTAKDRGQYDVF